MNAALRAFGLPPIGWLSDPAFARYRHEIWSLLRDEVVRAQAHERHHPGGGHR